MDEVIIIIISTTLTSAIWVAIIKLFGQGYLDKLNRDWKTQQERDIVELQSCLKREEESTLNLLKIFKSSTDEIQKKRILAASDLWESAMEMKDTTSSLFYYSTLLDSEISNPKYKDTIKSWLKGLPKNEDFLEKVHSLSIKNEKIRPFVTDETWKVYHVYNGFIIRTMFEVYDALRDNKEIPNWKKNEGTKKFLKLAFTDDDLEFVYRMSLQSYKIVFAYLEQRMIIEMNRVFSGEFNLRDQKELLKKVCDDIPNQTVTIGELLDKHEFQLLKMGF